MDHELKSPFFVPVTSICNEPITWKDTLDESNEASRRYEIPWSVVNQPYTQTDFINSSTGLKVFSEDFFQRLEGYFDKFEDMVLKYLKEYIEDTGQEVSQVFIISPLGEIRGRIDTIDNNIDHLYSVISRGDTNLFFPFLQDYKPNLDIDKIFNANIILKIPSVSKPNHISGYQRIHCVKYKDLANTTVFVTDETHPDDHRKILFVSGVVLDNLMGEYDRDLYYHLVEVVHKVIIDCIHEGRKYLYREQRTFLSMNIRFTDTIRIPICFTRDDEGILRSYYEGVVYQPEQNYDIIPREELVSKAIHERLEGPNHIDKEIIPFMAYVDNYCFWEIMNRKSKFFK